jgi:hypothetical protein
MRGTNLMKKCWGLAALAGVAAFACAASAQSVVFTQWNFDAGGLDADHPATSTGTGVASHIGGTTNTAAISGGAFPSQSGSSDTTAGASWSSVGYPDQSTNDKTAGFEFDVSSANYAGITFKYDGRVSGANSRYTIIQYSTDGGTTWVDNPAGPSSMGNASFTNGITLDLTGVTAANNNPNLKVRVVTTFSPNSFDLTATPPAHFDPYTGYQPATCTATNCTGTACTCPSNSTYVNTGQFACTFRVDMVTFSGTPLVSTPPHGRRELPAGGGLQRGHHDRDGDREPRAEPHEPVVHRHGEPDEHRRAGEPAAV